MNSKTAIRGFGLGPEPAPVQELTLQGGEETLAQGIIEAIADGSGGRPYTGLLASFSEGQRRILATLIGMVDHGLGRPPLPQRHIQGIQHQFRAQVRFHRPAHDPAGKGIQHHSQIQETRPGRNVGDVRHPQGWAPQHRSFFSPHPVRSSPLGRGWLCGFLCGG